MDTKFTPIFGKGAVLRCPKCKSADLKFALQSRADDDMWIEIIRLATCRVADGKVMITSVMNLQERKLKAISLKGDRAMHSKKRRKEWDFPEDLPEYCECGELLTVILFDDLLERERERLGPTDPRDYPLLICPALLSEVLVDAETFLNEKSEI